MKIKVNKKGLILLLATSMTFTLVGCSKKDTRDLDNMTINSEEYIDDTEEMEISIEDSNINLVVDNLPDTTRITLEDGTVRELNEFSKDNNSYQIPGKSFKINIDYNGNTYTYDINANNNANVFVSTSKSDNEPQVNIEKNNPLTFNSLQKKLANYNINLAHLFNNEDLTQNMVERQNTTYDGNNLIYDRTALSINDVILNEAITSNEDTHYNSPLRRGDGVNNIEIIDNNTVKLTYDRDYKDDYQFIENIENNINYFFNGINNTNDVEYYTSGNLDIDSIVNENTTIHEYIEKYYHGESVSTRYAYSYDNNNIIEFGQVNFDNEYFINDPYNLINTTFINKANNNSSSSNNEEYVDKYMDETYDNDKYVHYYVDDDPYYENNNRAHYYVDDDPYYDNDKYVHYHSDDDEYVEYNDDQDIYEYEEEAHKSR